MAKIKSMAEFFKSFFYKKYSSRLSSEVLEKIAAGTSGKLPELRSSKKAVANKIKNSNEKD